MPTFYKSCFRRYKARAIVVIVQINAEAPISQWTEYVFMPLIIENTKSVQLITLGNNGRNKIKAISQFSVENVKIEV